MFDFVYEVHAQLDFIYVCYFQLATSEHSSSRIDSKKSNTTDSRNKKRYTKTFCLYEKQ